MFTQRQTGFLLASFIIAGAAGLGISVVEGVTPESILTSAGAGVGISLASQGLEYATRKPASRVGRGIRLERD